MRPVRKQVRSDVTPYDQVFTQVIARVREMVDSRVGSRVWLLTNPHACEFIKALIRNKIYKMK